MSCSNGKILATTMVEDDGDNIGDNDVNWSHSFCNVRRLCFALPSFATFATPEVAGVGHEDARRM